MFVYVDMDLEICSYNADDIDMLEAFKEFQTH
jgi:hypothetical protein